MAVSAASRLSYITKASALSESAGSSPLDSKDCALMQPNARGGLGMLGFNAQG